MELVSAASGTERAGRAFDRVIKPEDEKYNRLHFEAQGKSWEVSYKSTLKLDMMAQEEQMAEAREADEESRGLQAGADR